MLKKVWMIALAAFSVAGVSQEKVVENPKPKPAPSVTIIVEMIEVPQSKFSDHLQDNKLKSDAAEFRETVQKWVKAETPEAKIRETIALQTRLGQRGKTESISQLMAPSKVTIPMRAAKKAGDDGEEDKDKPLPLSQTMSVEFSQKNAGLVFAFDVAKMNGDLIFLNFNPEWTFWADRDKWEVTADGKAAEIETARLDVVEMSTQVEVKNGGYAFLGTNRLPESKRTEGWEDSILLVFVRADSF